MSRLTPSTHLTRTLGFDTGDLVEVILVLERHFGIVIPDEVPLNTVADLIRYVASQTQSRAAAA